MGVRDFIVVSCDRSEVRDFIETYHYSGSINGIKSSYCFKLMRDEQLIGAAIFGLLGMASVWKKYANQREDLIELRRLCCIDETPRNTESYFIGHCLRWLKKNTPTKKVISYADPRYGHAGVIYQASNFEYLGKTAPSRVIVWGSREYHDKTIRTYYNGKLKPYAARVKRALESGEAYYERTPGKHIYLYQLYR